jgi:hypothetical protein
MQDNIYPKIYTHFYSDLSLINKKGAKILDIGEKGYPKFNEKVIKNEVHTL